MEAVRTADYIAVGDRMNTPTTLAERSGPDSTAAPVEAARRPLNALFLHRDLPFSGGVPQSFLNVARHTDRQRLSVLIGSFREPSTEMVEQFGALDVPVETLGDRYDQAIRKLRSVIAGRDVDAIVCGSFKSYLVARAATAGRSTRVVFWIPSIPIIEGRWRKLAFRLLSRRDPLLFISHAVRNAHQRSWHSGLMDVLYYGIDDPYTVERLEPYPKSRRSEFSIPDDAVVIGFIAEFVDWKNHQLLIRAFSALSERHPRLHLLLIGTGRGQEATRQVAMNLPGADRMHFVGARTDARRLFGIMDIYAHPSTQEGFGLVVAEAMLAQLPVVAANAAALPEFVLPGKTGLLFDAHDQHDLEANLETLMSNPNLAATLARRGREFALERLSPEAFASGMIDFLERVHGSPR